MLPELLVAHLTGEILAETTTAGSTGLLDLASGNWSPELCDAIALPLARLPGSSRRAPGSVRGVAFRCTSSVGTTRPLPCSPVRRR